jgi:hypothetical protein
VSYSIDTSALVDGWVRYYPPDVFPCLWGRIEAIITSGILVASDEVYIELQNKADELAKWANQWKGMFIPPDTAIQHAVSDIMSTHAVLVDVNRGGSAADPFVIAVAKVRGLTVVSAENSRPTKPKIPDVCMSKGVRHISLLEMFREQGWCFR